MERMLTQKQERFVRNLVEGKTQREAWIQAGYSSNYSMALVDSHACNLANSGKVKARYNELQKLADDATIATAKERKQILTQIARGNLLDYQELGADGGYLNIGKESPNTRAISEITSRTEYSKEGDGTAVVTKVKLHNPTQAIDLLNKMEKIYEDAGQERNINIVFVIGQGYQRDAIE